MGILRTKLCDLTRKNIKQGLDDEEYKEYLDLAEKLEEATLRRGPIKYLTIHEKWIIEDVIMVLDLEDNI